MILKNGSSSQRRRLTVAKHYIDREALIEWLKRIPLKDLSDGLGLCRIIMEDDFKKAIKNIPKGIVVDTMEIIRCKDCKHYRPQKKSAHWENRANYCNHVVTIKMQPDDFCSYGKRKDGDDE